MNVNRTEEDQSGHLPYLRNANYGAGSIRRLITLGSPFQGSPLAAAVAPILEPTELNADALILVFNNPAYESWLPGSYIDRMLFPDDGEGAYRAPTCAIDLTPMSSLRCAQSLLEGTYEFQPPNEPGAVPVPCTFPGGRTQVRWFAMVGLGNDADGSVPLGTWLDFLSLVHSGTGFEFLAINQWETYGDLIVPAASQRNSTSSGYHEYLRHSHSHPLPTDFWETKHWPMARHTAILLSSFPEGIDLPHLEDDDGLIADQALDVAFQCLSSPLVPCAP